jgi:hypothetical protein
MSREKYSLRKDPRRPSVYTLGHRVNLQLLTKSHETIKPWGMKII